MQDYFTYKGGTTPPYTTSNNTGLGINKSKSAGESFNI